MLSLLQSSLPYSESEILSSQPTIEEIIFSESVRMDHVVRASPPACSRTFPASPHLSLRLASPRFFDANSRGLEHFRLTLSGPLLGPHFASPLVASYLSPLASARQFLLCLLAGRSVRLTLLPIFSLLLPSRFFSLLSIRDQDFVLCLLVTISLRLASPRFFAGMRCAETKNRALL